MKSVANFSLSLSLPCPLLTSISCNQLGNNYDIVSYTTNRKDNFTFTTSPDEVSSSPTIFSKIFSAQK